VKGVERSVLFFKCLPETLPPLDTFGVKGGGGVMGVRLYILRG
jgi:hypothetical protein